jgi:hypothetical protein
MLLSVENVAESAVMLEVALSDVIFKLEGTTNVGGYGVELMLLTPVKAPYPASKNILSTFDTTT